MRIRTFSTIIFLLLFTTKLLYGQSGSSGIFRGWSTQNHDETSDWEIGIAGGGTEYFGDLTPAKRHYFNEATWHGGVLARYYLGSNFSVRGNLYAAKLAANDALYASPDWRRYRNFSFTTGLYEFSVMLEYDLLHTIRDEGESKFGIYAFVGLGLCYTDPHRNFNDIDTAYFGANDRAVSGLSADRNSDPKHIALIAPVGLGARYNMSLHTSLFAEVGVRHGFDDKIDGFSASVSSGKHDGYAFFSLGLCLGLRRRDMWWR